MHNQALYDLFLKQMSDSESFETFCDHAAHGHLSVVMLMLASDKLRVDGNAHVALVRAAENGHVVKFLLLRHAMFDPSADGNRAIWLLLGTATSLSSNDCCKTSASIRRLITTSPSDVLLSSATSRSLNGR